MIDTSKMSPASLKAFMETGSSSFGEIGSAIDHKRYKQAASSKSRRRCTCCKRRATHIGMANGVALMGGCEFMVTKWVRDCFPKPANKGPKEER